RVVPRRRPGPSAGGGQPGPRGPAQSVGTTRGAGRVVRPTRSAHGRGTPRRRPAAGGGVGAVPVGSGWDRRGASARAAAVTVFAGRGGSGVDRQSAVLA